MAMDAKKVCIEAASEEGKNVPEPKDLYESDYSGKFTLRLPKTFHGELALQAEDEGLSLNQYILFIAKGLNKREGVKRDQRKRHS